MDRTVLYREIVRIANESIPNDPNPSPHTEEAPPTEPDPFTKEANQIAAQLRRFSINTRMLRPRYLAISGSSQMTDAERDAFDSAMRQLIQRERNRVQALENWENKRRGIEVQHRESFTHRWFSHPSVTGASETLSAHHKGIIFYLNLELQHASQMFAELQGIRLARHAYNSRENATIIPASSFNSPLPANEALLPANSAQSEDMALDEPAESQSQAQQMIEEEHSVLLKDLNATLAKAQKAEQSLREIADLQSELSEHLRSQSDQLGNLTTDAFRTTTHVESANTQLQRAHKTSRRTSRMIIYGSISVGVFLLILNGR